MSDDACEHGVSTVDFCADCAHHAQEEWVGYSMLACAYCQTAWPCDYERARRAEKEGLMGCGHPPSAVYTGGEGTSHCTMCAQEAGA